MVIQKVKNKIKCEFEKKKGKQNKLLPYTFKNKK